VSEYLLRGNRAGFDLSGLERVDCPPNRGGFLYTEFRRPDGSVQAVIRSDLVFPLRPELLPERHQCEPDGAALDGERDGG